MRRIVAGLVSSLIAPLTIGFLAVSSAAIAEEGPELASPIISGPAELSPAELPKIIEAPPIPPAGPILIIPGMTPTRSGTRVRSSSVAASPIAEPSVPLVEGLPALVGPAGMTELPPRMSTTGITARPKEPTSGNGSRPPITLESTPADDSKEGGDASASPSQRRGNPSSLLEKRPLPSPFPRRSNGIFSRFLPPGSPANRDHVDARELIKVEPRSDPAADAALKRRIEKQIGEGMGSRLKSYEVRVVGRDIVVVARPARFWQKRSVKSSLESLPALQGYKARIEMAD